MSLKKKRGLLIFVGLFLFLAYPALNQLEVFLSAFIGLLFFFPQILISAPVCTLFGFIGSKYMSSKKIMVAAWLIGVIFALYELSTSSSLLEPGFLSIEYMEYFLMGIYTLLTGPIFVRLGLLLSTQFSKQKEHKSS